MLDELPYPVDGPVRSRFRGLSWDKKHQGWRVRIYYSGKQRHVGRYEDDITAAKAYDKAAVYLYGANAITNFGLSQVAEDPMEVSVFIVLAREQADREQSVRGQQRLHGCTPDPRLVKAAHQQLPSSPLLPGHLLVNGSSYSVPQTMYPLPLMGGDSLAWQQQMYGVSSSMQGITPQQQQQVWCHHPGLGQQAVIMASPGVAMDSFSSSMCSASSACTMSAAAASATSNMSSPVSAIASSTSYVLCTTPGGQHILVPISNATGDAAGGMQAVYSAVDASALMLQQQVPAQQLRAAQEHLSHSMVVQTQQQQQQQQHNLLLLNSTATSQPVQRSAQPQPTTIAGHMAAAHMPAAQQQHQLQQLQQQLAMSMPMAIAPTGPDSNNSMPAVSAAAGADSGAAAAAALVNRTATPAGLALTQTAGANTGSNIHSAAMLAGNAAGAPLTCATSSFVGDMLSGLNCYTSAAVTAAAAAAADRIANQFSPMRQQQPQPRQQLLQQVPLGSSRAAGDSMADCNSSSCSPMLGVARMLLETSTLAPSLGTGPVGQLGNHNGTNVMTSHGASFGSAQMAPSPTFCNGSSDSQSNSANKQVLY